MGAAALCAQYPLRPELAESAFYLFRATGDAKCARLLDPACAAPRAPAAAGPRGYGGWNAGGS